MPEDMLVIRMMNGKPVLLLNFLSYQLSYESMALVCIHGVENYRVKRLDNDVIVSKSSAIYCRKVHLQMRKSSNKNSLDLKLKNLMYFQTYNCEFLQKCSAVYSFRSLLLHRSKNTMCLTQSA
jgi:hypothetical protein